MALGPAFADGAAKKPTTKPIPVLAVGAEGADSASVDRTTVWNVRRGYNRVRVTTVSKAVYEGYRDVFINYDPTNSDAVRVEKAPIPPTTVDVRGTGTVRMECLRSKKSPWYSSRDSSRTVLSNTTRVYRLPIGNPARCRISVGLSAYNFGSDLVANDPYASVKVTYSLVRVQVQSVR